MKLKKFGKIGVALALTFSLIMGVLPGYQKEYEVSAAEVTRNIGVDIKGNENRAVLDSPDFYNWTTGLNLTSITETFDGVTCTLSSPTGEVFNGTQNKTLAKTDGTTPYITCDGIIMTGAIKLEISGLSAGVHTLTTWHSYFNYGSPNTGEIKISINDKVSTVINPSVKAATDLEASFAYQEFEIAEGETVTVLIEKVEGTKLYANPVLNGFEIDGVHPTKAIKNAVPVNNEGHHDEEAGLTWVGAEGAVAHNLYLGEDEYTVRAATVDSAEFKGKLTETKYSFDSELDHMKTYYWRVDEVFEDGSVAKGTVMIFQVRHLAFPTAEGYGRFAKGGRGGKVIEVTTLEDGYETITNEDGSTTTCPIKGSLRYAIEYETGPRIVVFKVGGVIELQKKLIIDSSHDNVYIAGQTAPGDGITLINYSLGMIGANDVIIRNMRVRVGDMNGVACDGMGMGSSNNCIIDHCSIAWGTDEGFSSRGAQNITLQYSIIAESLHESVHYLPGAVGERPDGVSQHSFAASVSGNVGSLHHNLLTNCTGRNWSLAGAMESDNKTYGGYMDISNNVIYNYTNRTTDGGVRRLNFVNNYYKMGHSSRDMYIVSIDGDAFHTGDCQIMYVSGNKLVTRTGAAILDATDDAWEKGYAIPGQWGTIETCKSDEPFFPNYITLESADDAYKTVLANAGARVPSLDYLDSRYVSEVENGTYTYTGSKTNLPGIADSQNDVGGYPNETNFKGGEAETDTDHDGMPDEWETAHGLNPEDAADNALFTLSAEGYTNIEMYLNELMGDPLVWAEPVEATETPGPTETATPEPTEIAYLLGDVNDDGYVDSADALMVLKHAARLMELDETEQLAGNVNKDENIDAADALEILKYAAKLITTFE